MTTSPSILGEWKERAARSTTLKMLSIGILILVLLVPSSMVSSLIRERERTRAEAVEEIASKWGGEQVVGGPVLCVPYLTRWKDEKGIERSARANAYFLPEALEVEGDAAPEIRYRGIYEAVLYTAALKVRGAFTAPDFSKWDVADRDVLWHEASLLVGGLDMKGIREGVVLDWGGRALPFAPGLESDEVFKSGIGVPVPLARGESHAFSFDLRLAGSGRLDVLPLGKETILRLASAWPSPSFGGAFLPVEREVTAGGFRATWKVLHFNRNYPQQWQGGRVLDAAFGVRLIVPVDEYQKTTRAAKYDVLFICLTFLLFFFVEVLGRRRLHPIQYLMVGLAVCLFYLLLLSLSEHVPFAAAYATAAAGVVALLTGYAKGVFANARTTAAVAAFTVGLYACLYVILQMEDYAVLMGSLALFAALAVVMYVSRKIDWYAL